MTKADEYDVANMSFFGTSGASTNYINMTIQNTGSSPWTLTSTAQVNSVTGLAVTPWWPNYNKATPAYNCTNGNNIKITIANVGWTSRQQYGVTFLLTDGDKITYSAIAP